MHLKLNKDLINLKISTGERPCDCGLLEQAFADHESHPKVHKQPKPKRKPKKSRITGLVFFHAAAHFTAS